MLPVSDPAPAALLLAAEPLRSAELLAPGCCASKLAAGPVSAGKMLPSRSKRVPRKG